MSYDDWLEAPYHRAAAQAEMLEKAWESLGVWPEDLEPPHKAGDACPHCAEKGTVVVDTDTDLPNILYCEACGEDVLPDAKPTFSILDWIQAQNEAAAEERAERRAEGW